MKIYVVFEFPEIIDPDSNEATFEIDSLSKEIDRLGYNWYIDDVREELAMQLPFLRLYGAILPIQLMPTLLLALMIVVLENYLRKQENHARSKNEKVFNFFNLSCWMQ